MSNGYLTSVALIIAIIITLIFNLKKGVNNVETRIFKKMLIVNILEALTTTTIVLVALTTNSEFAFTVLNRIDTILIISWCSLMFYYIYIISSLNPDKLMPIKINWINGTIFFLALFVDVEIIAEDGILDSTGPLTYLGLLGAVMYIISMIFILFFMK